ncbi:MAG TPA: FAD-dependent oxidoreductase [Steroidobacteraceae bacterium]|nr:FAD-dependent oxidoreductase [Steroidobacteraceae bacterium]
MPTGITRRDFMNGIAIAVAGAAGVDFSRAQAADALAARNYPPGRDGLRGSHVGSFEAAHRVRDGSPFDMSQAPLAERHDLVVVGAGISGLAAAYFYRQRRPNARVLILDTNDDFGGHAKRNEFVVDGQTLLGYGGTQSIDGPAHKWNGVAKGLLKDLGIDVRRFHKAFDRDFYTRWNLRQSVFFKREVFGVDRLVRRPFGTWQEGDENPHDSQALRAYLDQFPLGAKARGQLFEMFWSDRDVLSGKTAQQRLAVLEHSSYRDFIKQYWDADDEVVKFLQTRTHDLWAVGIDAVPASETLTLPGLKAQRAALQQEREEPYIYHFPDGNASIARMLVRRLIPGIAPGDTMEDIVLAPFDYGHIDRPEHPVRIRLNSTAVDVRNAARGVEVAYVNNGTVTRVAAADCVLACYHAMIPYIAPQASAAQRAALHDNVRAPLVYVNVVVRDWQPWHKLGVAYIDNPGGTFSAALDFPVSLDGYRFSADPSKPACLHLMHSPTAPNQGLNMREQYRAGRARLYAMSFADFEREIRDELGRMLGSAGFDFDRDVAAITVNRWPHGYAYTPTPLYDDPATQAGIAREARQRIGRIVIAGSDSGWDAYTHVAIDQAHRAVMELTA